jgi:uncharacterized FlaG/YvyC family protein
MHNKIQTSHKNKKQKNQQTKHNPPKNTIKPKQTENPEPRNPSRT